MFVWAEGIPKPFGRMSQSAGVTTLVYGGRRRVAQAGEANACGGNGARDTCGDGCDDIEECERADATEACKGCKAENAEDLLGTC